MEQLQAYLFRSGTRQAALAKQVGVSRGYMSQLVGGTKLPSLALAFKIERATAGAVPSNAWIADGDAAIPTPQQENLS